MKQRDPIPLESILLLCFMFLVCSVTSELCSSTCATDFCVPLYGVQDPLFNTPVYSLGNLITLMFPEELSYKLEADPNGSPTLTCSGDNSCNQICKANASLCSGDSTFCSNITCALSSQCYCRIENAAFHSYVTYNGTQMPILQQTSALLQSCTSFDQINQKRALEAVNSTVSLNQCSVYPILIDEVNLKITILPFPEPGYLKVYYLGETKILFLEEQATLFTIPPTWLTSTGEILLEYTSTSQYCFSYHPIIARKNCVVSDCILCSQAFANYDCLPPTYRNAMFWSIFLIVVILIFFAPFMGYMIYIILLFFWCVLTGCFKYSKRFHKTKIMKDMYHRASTKSRNAAKYFVIDEEQGNVTTQEDIDTDVTRPNGEHIKTHRRISGWINGRPIYANIIYISLLCLLVPCDAACSQGASVGSTQTQCLVNGTQQICTETYNVLATIPTLGNQYCFSLSSNGSAVWTGWIQHLGMKATLTLTSLYYTSAWSGFSQSSHWCDGTSKCSGGCSGTQSTRLASGALSDSRLNLYPGTTICHSSCGCVTCDGCFLCSPSCLYSGYGIIPSGTVYQVFSISSIVYTPQILVSVTGPNLNLQQIISPSSTATVIGNFTVQLVGSFTPPQISFSGLSVLKESTSQKYYFATAAQLNQITSGIPGDIQSSTAVGLTGVPASFKVGSIMTLSQGDLGDTYIFPASGVTSTFSTWNLLPATIGGNIWTVASSVVSSNITNAPSLAVSLQTPNGLKFSRTVNVVCPSFTVKNASGCYNCDAGSLITITAYSTCSAGAVSVTVSDLSLIVFTPGITLSSIPTDYIITIHPIVASNSFDLILSSSFSSMRKTISFTAVPVDRVVNNNDTSTNTTVLNNGAGQLSTDFLNFSSSVPGIITWVIIAIVIVVAAVILMPIFIKLIQTCLSPPKMS